MLLKWLQSDMAQEEQGHKVFISYKYKDNNVEHLDRSGDEPTIARHYVDEFQDIIGDSVHVNKGEKDGEDMSDFKDSTIESKLRNKIFDSTVTVVFISPNMKTAEPEEDQWIPWEISYSLRVVHRENGTSYCNGIVAVVLPDRNGSYEYMLEKRNCYGCHSKCTTWHTGKLFTILRLNMFNKHTKNDIYLNPNFVPKRLVTDAVYLTTEQIDEMIALDFESDEVRKSLITIYTKLNQGVEILPKHIPVVLRSMERTRDTFIAGCLTGQRESDYFRYNKDMICLLNGMKFLNVKQVKTKKTVMIPLDKRVEHIINKYGGKMPKLCKATLNLYLPVICEILGWTWIPTLNNPSSFGKSSSRFCDLVRSHTARRSFATNAYKAGIPISSIIAITGHAREEGLRRYLKIQAEEKAILAEQNMQGFIL